ncbi:hypothetical protein SAMN02745903_05380, partial [Pseudomonas sp. URMO17WK12:I5]
MIDDRDWRSNYTFRPAAACLTAPLCVKWLQPPLSLIRCGLRFSLVERRCLALDNSLLWPALSEASYGFFISHFEGQLHNAPYRSPFEHAKPTSPGPQTAVVVSPNGHELFTDSLNRVCVRFHWDRLSQDGELSSCWLRMLQPSSGPDWG